MDEQLRKRLEEAAADYIEYNYKDSIVPDWNEKDFIAGGEWMFKEAIALAKEWLDEHGKLDKLDLVEFDMGINKLWEEQE